MKTLVAYYSRTGNTQVIAKLVAKTLKADIDKIEDLKNRKGWKGWIFGSKDAIMRKKTKIKISKKPEEYDQVIIGTPVWAGTMVPAIRTYLEENKFKKIAFFCTYGGKEGKTFENMKKATKKPCSVFGCKKNNFTLNNINKFCSKLKGGK